jgi:poly-gamma-glutamate synthesis protein (capsule biosynthesis protein)
MLSGRRIILLLPILVVVVGVFIVLLPKSFMPTAPNPSLVAIPTQTIPTATPTPPVITVGLVGDLGLGRHITSTARNKNDFNWSFQEIAPWLSSNTFTLANLESPIIPSCPEGKTGTFTFCGDEKFVPSLKKYNFFLNLNNNHILNYRQQGLSDTKNFLNSADIPNFFEGLLIKEVEGTRLGFLGYDFITYPSTDTQKVIEAIKNARPQVDFLFISIHWGNEYLPQAEKWRVELAHQMVDAGADVIHGHHPHVWQGMETYRDKLIFYSFGNFVFDQNWSYFTSHSQIAKLKVQKGSPLQYSLYPIEIRFNSQPALMP